MNSNVFRSDIKNKKKTNIKINMENPINPLVNIYSIRNLRFAVESVFSDKVEFKVETNDEKYFSLKLIYNKKTTITVEKTQNSDFMGYLDGEFVMNEKNLNPLVISLLGGVFLNNLKDQVEFFEGMESVSS